MLLISPYMFSAIYVIIPYESSKYTTHSRTVETSTLNTQCYLSSRISRQRCIVSSVNEFYFKRLKLWKNDLFLRLSQHFSSIENSEIEIFDASEGGRYCLFSSSTFLISQNLPSLFTPSLHKHFRSSYLNGDFTPSFVGSSEILCSIREIQLSSINCIFQCRRRGSFGSLVISCSNRD